MRAKAELLDDARKRTLSEQGYPMDAKRQKMEGATPFVVPPLGPGPHSLASVFTLTNNAGLQAFDATLIPAPLAAKISIRALATVSPAVINAAINGVRDRLAALHAAGASAAAATAAVGPPVLNPATAPLGVDEDDDDYEPDLTPAEDTEQILNKLDNAPPEVSLEEENPEDSAALALGPFKLPSPPATDADSASKAVPSLATRLFELLPHLKESAGHKKAGFNRLAGSQDDRDWFATVIIRLATRGTSNLSSLFPSERALIKQEDGTVRPGLGDAIREILYNHVFEDWRRNIDTAIAWLTEEWYCDQVAKVTAAGNGAPLQLHYEKWALRVMDGFINYITAQDKLLTRFLAEIPELTRPLLAKLKVLCEDPTTVQLALTSLLYLVMTKPPAKELALDVVGEIWTECKTSCLLHGYDVGCLLTLLQTKMLALWQPSTSSNIALVGSKPSLLVPTVTKLAIQTSISFLANSNSYGMNIGMGTAFSILFSFHNGTLITSEETFFTMYFTTQIIRGHGMCSTTHTNLLLHLHIACHGIGFRGVED